MGARKQANGSLENLRQWANRWVNPVGEEENGRSGQSGENGEHGEKESRETREGDGETVVGGTEAWLTASRPWASSRATSFGPRSSASDMKVVLVDSIVLVALSGVTVAGGAWETESEYARALRFTTPRMWVAWNSAQLHATDNSWAAGGGGARTEGRGSLEHRHPMGVEVVGPHHFSPHCEHVRRL